MVIVSAFAAGYAVCRFVDEAFNRDWRRVGLYGGAAALMLVIALHG